MPRTGLGAVRFGFGGVFPLVSIRFSAGYSSIPMHRVIRGGPDPEKRPDRVKSEEADPPARVNGILMGMIPCFGDVIRNVVNRNHPVGEGQDDKDENDECEVAEKVHGGQLLAVKALKCSGCARRNSNLVPAGKIFSPTVKPPRDERVVFTWL